MKPRYLSFLLVLTTFPLSAYRCTEEIGSRLGAAEDGDGGMPVPDGGEELDAGEEPDATSCVVCMPPPAGCTFVGGTCESCGTIECPDPLTPCDESECGEEDTWHYPYACDDGTTNQHELVCDRELTGVTCQWRDSGACLPLPPECTLADCGPEPADSGAPCADGLPGARYECRRPGLYAACGWIQFTACPEPATLCDDATGCGSLPQNFAEPNVCFDSTGFGIGFSQQYHCVKSESLFEGSEPGSCDWSRDQNTCPGGYWLAADERCGSAPPSDEGSSCIYGTYSVHHEWPYGAPVDAVHYACTGASGWGYSWGHFDDCLGPPAPPHP